MKEFSVRTILLILAPVFISVKSAAQSCGGTVPSYTIDMTGNPDSVWTSPSVSRNGHCCSASGSDRCIVFYVTLDSFAAGLRLDVVGGLGGTTYQVNCGTAITLGASTCISASSGQIKVTLCKPGGNAQQYTITSIPGGYASASSVYISKNCVTTMAVQNLVQSSITWTALDTNYNYALSCRSGCDTTVVTADTTFPSTLDVKVCGTPVNPCAGLSFCDTLRVTFLQDLTVTLNPQATYICTGVPTKNVKASATGGKRPYSYSWTGTSDTDSSIDVGAGTYIVTVTDAALCQVAKDTVVITAASLPAPSISGLTSVCPGATQSYSVTSVSGHSYSWNVTNGTINGSSTSNSVSVTWGTSGSTSLSITQTNNTTGCVGTDNESITFNPVPAPSISGSAAPCVQGTYTYSVTAVSGHSYSWNVTNGTINGSSTSNSVSITWPSTGSGNVSITQTNNTTGCIGTDNKSITIQPLPAPSVSGSATPCMQGTYTYSVTAVIGHSYSWNVTNGTINGGSTSNSLSVTWPSTGSGNVSITQTNNSTGCIGTDSKSITVQPLPTPNIGGTTSVCEGMAYTYSVTSVSGHSYSWGATNGTIIGSSTSNSVYVRWGSPTGGSVNVTQTSAAGCIETDNQAVTITAAPVTAPIQH